jgi:hypothetical protein
MRWTKRSATQTPKPKKKEQNPQNQRKKRTKPQNQKKKLFLWSRGIEEREGMLCVW